MTNIAKRLLRRASGNQTVGGAAAIIAGAYLVSRLLGLLRDRLLVSNFGTGPELDAYNAAFRLPDLIFTLLVSGAFAVSFIPVLTGYLQKDQRATAWRATSTLLNILLLATAAGSLLIILLAGPLTSLITPGFNSDPSRHELTVHLTRIMAITPVLFAISSVLGAVQQSFNRFLFFAFAGVFYNLGIIGGIIWFAPSMGVSGVAWGVVIGVALQALVQTLGLLGLGYRYRPILDLKLAGVRQTLKLMVPRSLDQGIDQLNYVVETIIGSLLAPGSITAFALANNLRNVPLVLISSSISTAVFPQLAARAARGARSELITGYVRTARLILFLAIPAAVVAVVARGYIVRLLYGFGSATTANTLGWFAASIIFASLFMLVSRVYFAMQDTRTPLYVSLGSVPLNMVLSFVLAHKFGVIGLAMAASLVSIVETVILMALLRRREGSFGEGALLRAAVPMSVAGLITGGVVFLMVNDVLPLLASDKGFITLASKFVAIILVGAAAYLLSCYAFRVPEVKLMIGRLRDAMARSTELT